MVAPQACVAVEIAGAPAAELRGALERRCSDILGAARCRVIEREAAGEGCWRVEVTTGGGDSPREASVALRLSDPLRAPVTRDVTFRPNDAVADRWATLGLVIAALVTVEEHSAAEVAAPTAPSGGGFAPVIGLDHEAALAPSSAPLTFEARAAAVGSVGMLPSAAAGARVELSVARGPVAVLARATLFPEDSRASLDPSGASAELQLWTAGLGACGQGARGRWGLRACAGADVARTTATGSGVSETNSARSWWASTWLGVSAELRLYRHLALTADLEGAVVYWRPVFAINGVDQRFTAAPVAGVLAFGVAVPF
jgi:hypothetical protein